MPTRRARSASKQLMPVVLGDTGGDSTKYRDTFVDTIHVAKRFTTLFS